MTARVFTLILCLFFTIISNSQQTFRQTIRGVVVDAVTDYPLVGANIILLDSVPPIGAMSDQNGKFTLNEIPVGRHSIQISYMGYHSQTLNNLLLTSAKELQLNVKLEESTIKVDEVVVKANDHKEQALNEMAMISARTFSVEETERFAGSLGDPARMVANYAGVAMHDDSRNDIIIRGNSPTGVLWRMEGIEIPNPNHFGTLGTTGGPVSMINNNLLSNSDFLTGAFPAEFGNALAGVFDLNIRSGNNKTTEFVGQVGFNGFELGAEGPFLAKEKKVRPSYIANYRYSTLDVMQKMGFSFGTGTAIPEYQDLTFLVDIPATKSGRYKIFGLWGKSNINLGRDLSDTTGNSYNLKGWATDFGSTLAVAGITHTYFFNPKTRLKSTVSYQTTTVTTKVDSINYEIDGFTHYYGALETEDKFSVSSQFKHKINSKNNYSLGVIADLYGIDYTDSVYDLDYHKFIRPQEIDNSMELYRVYAQWQHKFSNNLTAYAGLNSQIFSLNNQWVAEPRASLKWQFAQNQSLSAGYGKHSQIQAKSIYFVRSYKDEDNSYFTTNEELKFTRSDHYILGYDLLMKSDFRIKAETYYQHLYDVPIKENFPEYSMLNSGADFGGEMEDSLINAGKGRNLGVEITLEKFLTKGYYILFTASLFDSKYTGYDGIWRNTAFNGNYVFNILGGYEHKILKNAAITVDLKTVWAGGKRYVPVDFEASEEKGEEVRDWTNAFEDKYKDYFRTDLRIGFKLNGKKITQEYAVDLQNLFNYQSIYMENYDAQQNEVYFTYQQSFYPMFLYRLYF